MSVPAVETEALGRRFGSVAAVDGVNLRVDPGEIFGFLGPNGAGKSTCVRILVTLLRPTSGRARVLGFDVDAQARDVRRLIGVALQEAAIDPLMTGWELVHLQAALHGIPRRLAGRRGGELLERVGLSAVGHRQVGSYSGGMRRRLDLALALVHEPEVLFLDEPTTGLDPMSRVDLWEEVRRLNTEYGTTVFLTTQYLEEADRLAERVAIIDHGRIVREGTPHSLKLEVGSPTLSVAVPRSQQRQAADLLARFGEPVPADKMRVAARLPGGAATMAAVVRALDKAGIEPQALELTAPSLEDVFIDATGRTVEADDDSDAVADPAHLQVGAGPAPVAQPSA